MSEFDWFKTIKDWEFKRVQDYYDFAKLIINCWDDGYGSSRLYGRKLTLITGGWSGNEEVMSAIDGNKYFNTFCLEMWRRGGLFVYELPDKKIFDKK